MAFFRRWFALPLLCAAASCAQAGSSRSPYVYDAARALPVGTVLHYTKSDRGGRDPWHLDIYVQAPDRIEVIKWRKGGADFVEVMAHYDPQRGMPVAMQQWNTAGGVRRPTLALLTRFDADRPTLQVTMADGNMVEIDGGGPGPLHVWGFDLAGVGLMLPHLSRPKSGFAVRMGDPNRPGTTGPILVATAEFDYAGDAEVDGVRTHRYRMRGAFFEGHDGDLWVNAKTGWVERAVSSLPTSIDWVDWKLELESQEAMSPMAWERFKADLAMAQQSPGSTR